MHEMYLEHQLKPIKVMKKSLCKQTAVLGSASITLDNNNDVLTDFYPIFLLYTLPYTSVSLTGCISIVFSVLNILTHVTTMLLVGSL